MAEAGFIPSKDLYSYFTETAEHSNDDEARKSYEISSKAWFDAAKARTTPPEELFPNREKMS